MEFVNYPCLCYPQKSTNVIWPRHRPYFETRSPFFPTCVLVCLSIYFFKYSLFLIFPNYIYIYIYVYMWFFVLWMFILPIFIYFILSSIYLYMCVMVVLYFRNMFGVVRWHKVSYSYIYIYIYICMFPLPGSKPLPVRVV